MAWLPPVVLVVLALAAAGVEAQPPVLAVQTALILYAARQPTWTSPTTGIVYVADEPWLLSTGTTQPCYGRSIIQFANGEDQLYLCSREGTTIDYRFPSIPNGNYRLFLITSETQYGLMAQREFTVTIEGQYRDTVVPYAKIGVVQAAVQLEYCVTINDGDLTISLAKTASSSLPACVSAIRLEIDNGTRGPCPTPLTRYDFYQPPARGVWTYSINCGQGAWRSPNGFMWQVDYGYYQLVSGVLSQNSEPYTYAGMIATDSFFVRQSDDTYVFGSRRRGNDMKYAIPIAAGTYTVVTWFVEESDVGTMLWEYGGRVFNMSFEGSVVRTIDIFGLCGRSLRACPVVFRNVAINDGTFDITFASVRGIPMISAIQIKPEDGTGVPAYINYPGRFLADTGKDRPYNWPGVQGNVLYAINSGGPEWLAPDGLLFTTDWGYDSASRLSYYGQPVAMTNTSYAQVYYASRRLSSGVTYTLPVYDAGTYTVRVYTADAEGQTRNVRILLQGSQVDAFAIFTRAGGQYAALELDYEVTVAANQPIVFSMVGVSGGDPIINAIEVRIGPKSAPRTLPPAPTPAPRPPTLNEQFPVPWDGTVPAPVKTSTGPFPAYKGKVMPDGKELVFAMNFAPPYDPDKCYSPGCGEYVATTGITYMDATPFFIKPFFAPLCYGDVSGLHSAPGSPYKDDLPLARCHMGNFRAYFPNVAPGEYRLRTLHHEEKWCTVLETAYDGTGGRGGYIDINDVRINTQDYVQQTGHCSILFYIDHCITVDARGAIEFSSVILPGQSSSPNVQGIELWKKDWTNSCPYSIYDRQDLISPGSECLKKPLVCPPCNGTTAPGELSCLRRWSTPQPTIEYAINIGGAPYESTANGIYYSVDTKFGYGPWHRTGFSIGYDNNNGVIDGTEDDYLFQTRRITNHGYWLPVSRPGRYLVIIGGMESDRPWIGGRVYTLSLEGVLADTIDHYLRCGARYRACYNAYYVYVWDGMLNLYVEGAPQLNTLLLIRDDGTATIPAGIYVRPAGKPYGWKLQNGNVLVAINCGAGEVVDTTNNFVWFTDTYFSATKSSFNVATTNYGFVLTAGFTVAPSLFVSQRTGATVTYDVLLPASGMTVTLEVFCNEYEYPRSVRTQTITVEGGQVTDGPFDPFACAGNSQNECKRTIPNIVVADNILTFTVTRVTGSFAVIAAFRVIGISGMPADVATPPSPFIPVIGAASCVAGTLGCPCLAGNTCNPPNVCSAVGGCIQPSLTTSTTGGATTATTGSPTTANAALAASTSTVANSLTQATTTSVASTATATVASTTSSQSTTAVTSTAFATGGSTGTSTAAATTSTEATTTSAVATTTSAVTATTAATDAASITTFASTTTAAAAGNAQTSGGKSSHSSSTIIIVVVVVVAVLVLAALGVLAFVFREKLFGSKSAHRPTFHEEEMYATNNVQKYV